MTKRKNPKDCLKRGRKESITPEKKDKLEEAFMLGCTDSEAMIHADVKSTAFYDYCNRHPNFAERKELLKEKPILKARVNIIKGLNAGDTELSKWYLEKKRKVEFSSRIENTGVDGQPISYIIDTGIRRDGDKD